MAYEPENKDVKYYLSRLPTLYLICSSRGYTCLSEDRCHLLVSNLHDGVDLYDFAVASTGLHLSRSYQHAIRVNVPIQVASVMDGTWVVTGSDEGTVRIFDQRSGELLHCLHHDDCESPYRTTGSDRLCTVYHYISAEARAVRSSKYFPEPQQTSLIKVQAYCKHGGCIIVSGSSSPGPSSIKVWSSALVSDYNKSRLDDIKLNYCSAPFNKQTATKFDAGSMPILGHFLSYNLIIPKLFTPPICSLSLYPVLLIAYPLLTIQTHIRFSILPRRSAFRLQIKPNSFHPTEPDAHPNINDSWQTFLLMLGINITAFIDIKRHRRILLEWPRIRYTTIFGLRHASPFKFYEWYDRLP